MFLNQVYEKAIHTVTSPAGIKIFPTKPTFINFSHISQYMTTQKFNVHYLYFIVMHMQFQEVCVSECATLSNNKVSSVLKSHLIIRHIKVELKTNVSDTLMTDDNEITFQKH